MTLARLSYFLRVSLIFPFPVVIIALFKVFTYIYVYTINQHIFTKDILTLYPAIQCISFLRDKLKNKYGFSFPELRNLTSDKTCHHSNWCRWGNLLVLQ